MGKLIGRIGICLLVVCAFWAGTVISDRQRLGEELVRLHVVAASDEKWDQELKLRVRDAVSESLRSDLEKIRDAGEAKRYLQEKLPYIREVAQSTLRVFGCQDTVSVSLCREVFDRRVYDTFSLPAGVYDALRIVIGEGQGKNWWCVVFPGLCIPAASEDTAAVAAGAGFPEGLNNTLIGKEGYELRFGILDAMGKLENLFFGE